MRLHATGRQRQWPTGWPLRGASLAPVSCHARCLSLSGQPVPVVYNGWVQKLPTAWCSQLTESQRRSGFPAGSPSCTPSGCYVQAAGLIPAASQIVLAEGSLAMGIDHCHRAFVLLAEYLQSCGIHDGFYVDRDLLLRAVWRRVPSSTAVPLIGRGHGLRRSHLA